MTGWTARLRAVSPACSSRRARSANPPTPIASSISAACPLTNVMESQIRTELAQVRGVGDFRVDWQWIPAWRPADITDGGREQLRAIGFTI